MPTLNLKYHKPTSVHPNGLWMPADHESQRLALMHFSGGSEAISYDRLAEITYVAGIHGWCTCSEGNPASLTTPKPMDAAPTTSPSDGAPSAFHAASGSRSFGVRLRTARDGHRWTQAEAAKQAGIQPAAWSHFETGQRTPHIRNLRAICKALHISADYLLDI